MSSWLTACHLTIACRVSQIACQLRETRLAKPTWNPACEYFPDVARVLGREWDIIRPYIVLDRSKIKILNIRDSNIENTIVEH